MHERRVVTTYVLMGMALVGMAVVVYATDRGIGVSPDSVTYLDAARHLFERGYVVESWCGGNEFPVIKFPPFYPMLLAVIEKAGIDPLVGARWLNVVLFGANICLVGYMLKYYTRGLYVPALGTLLALSSFVLLKIHAWAWSEPLFLFLALMELWLLSVYIEKGNRLCLLAGAMAVCLAFLTRFIGGSLVATGILGILWLGRGNWRRKGVDAAVFLSVSIFPMVLWSGRNIALTGRVTSRSFGFYPFSFDFLGVIGSWLVPGSDWFSFFSAQDFLIRSASALFLLFLLVSGIWFIAPAIRDGEKPVKAFIVKTPWLPGLFIPIYFISILIARLFFDPGIPFDYRIFSPAFVSGIIVVLYLLHGLFFSSGNRLLRRMLIWMGLAEVGVYLICGAATAIMLHHEGSGYTGRIWQYPRMVGYIEKLPAEMPVFSNYPLVVHFHTGRPVCPIPRSPDREGVIVLVHYRRQLPWWENVPYLEFLGTFSVRDTGPSEADMRAERTLQERLPVRRLMREGNAVLFSLSRPRSTSPNANTGP